MYLRWSCRYLCIVSPLPSADGDQWCHFQEKGGEITAPEVNIALLQIGSAEKRLFATYINAYLKKKSISVGLYAKSRIFSMLYFAARPSFILVLHFFNCSPSVHSWISLRKSAAWLRVKAFAHLLHFFHRKVMHILKIKLN